MKRAWVAGAALLALSACSPKKEALVRLDVTVADGVSKPLSGIKFSVVGRGDLQPYTVPKDPRPEKLKFGYYLPVSGHVDILAQALNASGCVVGEGRAAVDNVVAGEKTAVVPLTIAALSQPVCQSDGGTDGRTDGSPNADGNYDGADATPDAPPKLGRGEACTSDGQCALGHCVDGVCCESTCLGTCESCGEDNQKGTCVAVTGAPRGKVRPACVGAGTSCAGACDGENRTSCAYPDEKTVCGAAQCMNGMGAGTRTCDRAGACREAKAVACGSGTCESASKCTNGCDSGSAATACPGTHFCNAAGACEPKVANGDACSTDAHCVSGSCVDGRCCTVTCAPCQACTGTGGTCAPIMGQDDPGSCAGDRTCNASGVCKTRPGKLCTTAAECSSGNCVDGRCCNATACGTCEACIGGGGDCVPVTGADDTDSCMGASSCDIAGTCKLKLGEACKSGSDCLQGFCVDGVCCESACSGACEACGETDHKGTCFAVTGPPRGDRTRCTGNGTACAGACDGTNRTACGFPGATTTCGMPSCTNGMATPAPTCDGSGGCKQGMTVACMLGVCASTTTCQGGCSATVPCPTTQFCTSAGACQTKVANGMACTADGECTSAHCVDQRCCGVASCGSCEACTGTGGTCTKITNADDPNSCTSGTCDAAGACKAKPGQTCAADGDCITGHCVDQRCCMVASCGACEACTGGGGACVKVMGADDDLCTGARTCNSAGVCKTKRGETCSVKEDCITDNCVDGVCCESACSGQCEACGETGSKGTCVAVSGAPRSVPYRAACAGTGAPCAGSCSGTNRNACTYSGTSTTCGNPTCTGGIAAPAPTCDGLGGCKPGMSVSCNSNLCANATTCAGACNPTTAPCPSTQYCNSAGACVTRITAGGVCTADNQCAGDHCVDGRCCLAAACGTCQSCTGTGGTCVAVTGTEDPDSSCSGTRTCDNAGSCKSKPGETCTAGSQCTTGSCVDGRCCTTSSCGTCRACTGGGGTCVPITGAEDPDGNCSGSQICDSSGACKTKQGQTCSVGSDCVTGQCADNRCCNSACNGTCQTCGSGSCNTVTSGDDDTCTDTRTCVAGGSCRYKPGQACFSASDCSTGNCVNGRCCNLSGCPACQVCGPAGTCVAGNDGAGCGAGMMCSAGSCVPNSGCSTGTIALGCACSSSGALACNGAHQALRLRCVGGEWTDNGTCPSSPTPQNCGQTDGQCHNIIPQCQTGSTFCSDMNTQQTCNADYTATTPMTCAGVCSSNVCQAARCGDMKVQSGSPLNEECDDGNAVAGDGCEPDCKRSRVSALAAGGSHSCALLASGDVRCWGENGSAQLGIGNTNPMGTTLPFQIPLVTFGSRATAIAAGTNHTCVILTGGSVRCWGANDVGQLGQGDVTARTAPAPAIAFSSAATKISAGGSTTCVVLQNGDVRCWGANTGGMLGLAMPATATPSATTPATSLGPVAVGGAVANIGVGTNHVCAVLQTGPVLCWGGNTSGQLGRGDTVVIGDNETPAAAVAPPGGAILPPGRSATGVASGSAFSCVRHDNGQMQCWGGNSAGQLGLGINTAAVGDDESPSSAGLVMLTNVSAVVTANTSTCVLMLTGGMRCWGLNSKGQLGYSDITNKGADSASRPSVLPDISFGSGTTATAVGMGLTHVCALLTSSTTTQVKCWGRNHAGQLGNGQLLSGTSDYVGGKSTETPDLLPQVRIFQ